MNCQQFALLEQMERRHWWFAARRKMLSALLERLIAGRSGARVLDVGCGTGGTLESLADAYDCVGIDPSPDAIRIARARVPHAKWIHGDDVQVIAEECGRANMVLLLDVLEHVRDDRTLFDRIAYSMKIGAHLVVTVPADPKLWSHHDVALTHFRRYELTRFRHLWRSLPLRCLLCTHFNARLYWVVRCVRALSRWRSNPFGEHGTDLFMPPLAINEFLCQIFAGERFRILRCIGNPEVSAFARGVSLMAVLQRIPGSD